MAARHGCAAAWRGEAERGGGVAWWPGGEAGRSSGGPQEDGQCPKLCPDGSSPEDLGEGYESYCPGDETPAPTIDEAALAAMLEESPFEMAEQLTLLFPSPLLPNIISKWVLKLRPSGGSLILEAPPNMGLHPAPLWKTQRAPPTRVAQYGNSDTYQIWYCLCFCLTSVYVVDTMHVYVVLLS